MNRVTWGGEPVTARYTFVVCRPDDPDAAALVIEGRRRIPLLTGKLRGRRVEHARAVRVATWKRRRERRHGIPAASVCSHTFIPHARLQVQR